MRYLIAVGVAYGPVPDRGFTVWLPVFVLLSFVLVWLVAGLRVGVWSSIAAVAGGTLWADTVDQLGLVGSSAAAIVVAFVGGEVVRRVRAPRRRSTG